MLDLMQPGEHLGGDPAHYKVLSVSWWQEHETFRHQFLVIETESRAPPSPRVLWIRLERDKDTWTNLSLNKEVRIAEALEDLSTGCNRIAKVTVNDIRYAHSPEGLALSAVGHLLRVVHEESPRYILPTLNCWWFALCCFERLSERLGWENLDGEQYIGVFGVEMPSQLRLREADEHPVSEIVTFCLNRTLAHCLLLSHSPAAATVLMTLPIIAGVVSGVHIDHDHTPVILLACTSIINIWMVAYWTIVILPWQRVCQRFGSRQFSILHCVRFIFRFPRVIGTVAVFCIPQFLFFLGMMFWLTGSGSVSALKDL